MSATETTTTVIPAGTWAIDPVHTSIGFQVTDTTEGFSTASGRFTDTEGAFEGGDAPSITGTIRVAGLRTDNEQRDAHLLSSDFLEGEKYPEIHFFSKSIAPLDAERFVVRGDLIVKDAPVEVELEGKIRGVGVRAQTGTEQIVIDARGEFAWGPFTVEVNVAATAVKDEA
jgi:polyisoprenoid-binding protein YceI